MSNTMRVAVVAEGSDLGVPLGWEHWSKASGEWERLRFEPNPDYVPPPPPTQRELTEQRIADLEEELASERAYLTELDAA